MSRPAAEVGIRHAIWAAVVSGAMNGRMLWWQDGYDQFEKADLCRHYQQAAATAASFVSGMDFTDFAPIRCKLSSGLKGAVIGNRGCGLRGSAMHSVVRPIGRRSRSSGQHVAMEAPGGSWQVEFFDPITGMSDRQESIQRAGPAIADPAWGISRVHRGPVEAG